MSYEIIREGWDSYIKKTDREVNEFDVFKTFSEAKNELKQYFVNGKYQYTLALSNLSKVKKQDIN